MDNNFKSYCFDSYQLFQIYLSKDIIQLLPAMEVNIKNGQPEMGYYTRALA